MLYSDPRTSLQTQIYHNLIPQKYHTKKIEDTSKHNTKSIHDAAKSSRCSLAPQNLLVIPRLQLEGSSWPCNKLKVLLCPKSQTINTNTTSLSGIPIKANTTQNQSIIRNNFLGAHSQPNDKINNPPSWFPESRQLRPASGKILFIFDAFWARRLLLWLQNGFPKFYKI